MQQHILVSLETVSVWRCQLSDFITICVSLGVRCSTPPPGGTSANEDATSTEHPPVSVL